MENFIKQLSLLKPNSTFLTLKGYRNEHSEVADYSIVFNMSYENALNKSLEVLKAHHPSDTLEIQAKEELINSFNKSLNNLKDIPMEELEDHYVGFLDENGKYIKGIKAHIATNTLHLYGLIVHKKVIIPGSYPVKNKLPLTIAKDKLRRMVPVGRFRQFKITSAHVDYISVNNLSLLPPE